MNIFIDPQQGEASEKEEPRLLFTPRPSVSLRERMPTVPQLAVALGGLALVFGISYVPGLVNSRTKEPEPRVRESITNEPLPLQIDHFEDVALTAHAAYVWDAREERALYNKNAGDRLPLASLTKLMTALVAYDTLGKTDTVTVTPDALMQEGESYLMPGTTFTVQDLTDFVLLTSSNDGAYALAAAAGLQISAGEAIDAFVTAMNAKAESLGLSQSSFSNPTGLDVSSSTSGGYGSARDVAFLMEYLIEERPDLLATTRERASTFNDQLGTAFAAFNTNEIVGDVPGILGSKTGFTDLAGGNLVVAFDAGLNRPIIISVLGSTREGRFTDVMTLVTRTQQALSDPSYGN